MSTQKQIFITGIAGFIGFHLASLLQKKKYYVIGCDNFNDYYSPALKKQRAEMLCSQAIEHSVNAFQIYNLGNHQSEELMTLLSLIEEHLDKKAIIKFKPMQPGDVIDTCADNTRANQALGFTPQISLCQGMGLFLDWYLRHQKSIPQRNVHRRGLHQQNENRQPIQ